MTREVPEWVGKHDDAPIPPRVKLRVFEKHKGICPACSRKLQPGKWDCDHIVALVNGGEHREGNLQPLCVSPCHSNKTKEDSGLKSKTYKAKTFHLGIKRRKWRPIPGSKLSGIKKGFDGIVRKR